MTNLRQPKCEPFSRVLNPGTAARRAVMLGYPPVAVAPDEYPGHSTWTELVAIGKINVACGDRNIRSDLPNSRHGVGFHTYASWALAEIVADGVAAILQFIDRADIA